MRLPTAICLVALLPGVAWAQSAAARYVGKPIAAIEIVAEGRPTDDPAVTELVQTRVGQPLSMIDVRETISHLFSLGRYQDVQVDAEESAAGVTLRFNLIPVHRVQRVEYRGRLGLSESLLRRTVSDRFSATPPVGRAAEVVRTLEDLYRDHGYFGASIRAVPTVLHDPDRTVLTFEIDHGPRALVRKVDVVGSPLEDRAEFLRRIGAIPGEPYERAAIQRRLSDYVARLKEKRHYEAVASHHRAPSADDAVADLTIDVQPGPIVTVVFEGDPLPADRRDELVPIEREGSVDEDLLEDSVRRIQSYLQQQGYWKATATFDRQPSGGGMTILITVRRGLQYRIANGVEIAGNRSVPLEQLRPLLERLAAGELYAASNLDAAVAGITALYRTRGFARVKVDPAVNEINPIKPGEGLVRPVIAVTEGPLIVVGDVLFTGNKAMSEAELRALVRSAPGQPYYEPQIVADGEAMLLRYRNLGFASASVVAALQPLEDGSRTTVRFEIQEGPQTIVDHIIIVGNTRTDPQVIQRELLLAPGRPLGLEDQFESRRRLGALGLFRRVQITPISHGSTDRQDVLVTVEEAPATTYGYGGGVEASKLLRATGPDREAEERFEFAPRGFFEIGRRNLGGRNRAVNLYTRLSLRPDRTVDDGSRGGNFGFGFSEYRVVATYREPRAFGINADLTVTGAVEQGVRTSFNFARKGVNAELNRRISPGIRASGRYSFGTTRTFDEQLSEEQQAAIDRLFPQVRLSAVSGAIARDTRDDLLDPARGTFLSAEGSLASRGFGGQVGFIKSYVQAFWFRRLPGSRRVVFATRAAVGLADGFKREAPSMDPDGNPVVEIIDDLPASERFFAGGDMTIRGFALDTVGTPQTISATGFPRGGNAVVILNAELRLPVWRDLGAAVFVDGGNVFERVTDVDVGELRGSVGFGVRYRSPIGPVRLDVGFKMDRRMVGGSLEPRRAIHFSIGQAF